MTAVPGPTQFSELEDRVLAYGFSDSKFRVSIGTWLNEAQRKIAEKVSVRDFFTTTSATTSSASNALPADFLRLPPEGGVRLTTDASNPTVLDPMDLRDYDDAPASTGTPQSYIVVAGNLIFYPSPDSSITYELAYYRRPVEMADDTDSPDGILSYYDDVMVSWALKRAYEREADFEAAAYWAADFQNGLSELQGQLQTDTEVPGGVIPGMWAGGQAPRMVIPR